MLADTAIRYAVPAEGGNPDIEIDGVFPGQALRAPEIAQGASNVAAIPFVRAFTLQIQRDAAKNSLVVMEGRDIGTAVFPDAKYKFFLTASPRVRALRRLAQGGETPDNATVDSVAAEIAERDRQDMNRSVAPLKQAEDAVFIDSSGMTAEEVLDAMVLCIRDGEEA
jgi:cytidylate kinase